MSDRLVTHLRRRSRRPADRRLPAVRRRRSSARSSTGSSSAREAWRVERNRSMGLPRTRELVHALFGEAMVDIYLGQDAIVQRAARSVSTTPTVRNARARGRGHRRRGALRRLPEQQRAAVGRRVPVPGHHAGAAPRRRARSSTAGSPTSAAELPGPAGRRRHRAAPRHRRRGRRGALGARGRPRQRHAADRRLRAASLPRPALRPALGRVRRARACR